MTDEPLAPDLMTQQYRCPSGYVLRQREWHDRATCTGCCRDCEVARREVPLHKEAEK